MIRVAVLCAAVIGCGGSAGPSSSSSSATPQSRPTAMSAPAPDPPAPDPDAEAARAEQARKDELAAAHRELEAEQQEALAATCTLPAGQTAPPRCEPSCYRTEPADPRAGTRFKRAEIIHLVCRGAAATAPLVFADEIGGKKVAVRAARGRAPKPHKPSSWQGEVELAVATALEPEVGRGDVIRVTSGWKSVRHPVTRDRLRCVTVSHRVRSMRRALDACGGGGGVACEASGNAAAHGINVVHYRLAEARRLHAGGDAAGCQKAALEAVAVARGLPRWRQYVTLNVDQWKGAPRYRTRFDGILDEDTLFTTAIALGADAQALHAECGGAAAPQPTAAQEQSFHTCW